MAAMTNAEKQKAWRLREKAKEKAKDPELAQLKEQVALLSDQLARLRPLRRVSTAMTNAEKQKAYRERKKAEQEEKDRKLAELEEANRRREQQVRNLKAKLQQKQPSI